MNLCAQCIASSMNSKALLIPWMKSRAASPKNTAANLALNKSVRDKDKEISAKQREYGELYSGGSMEKKTALVNVEAKVRRCIDRPFSMGCVRLFGGHGHDFHGSQDCPHCGIAP